jgi:hypothetical protein
MAKRCGGCLHSPQDDRHVSAISRAQDAPFRKHRPRRNSAETQPASELYRPADLMPTFAYRGCRLVSVTDPYVRNLGFLSPFFHVAPQLYSLLQICHYNYNCFTNSFNLQLCVFTSLLVRASNGERFPSSGFPNCLRPHLPASQSNSSHNDYTAAVLQGSN